jgi:hypothetical protein
MKQLLLIFSLVVGFSHQAQSMGIDWSGLYRFEWFELDKPTLSNPKGRKAYGLNYLSLKSKVIASDGITLVGRFDLLSSEDTAYSNSNLGQMWGTGSPWNARQAHENSAYAKSMGAGDVRASELYVNIDREYNGIVVGRAPFAFGLGMNYNAGKGAFDHWSTTRDMLAYKIISGNLSIMPMIGKAYQKSPAQGNTITEEVLRIDYNNVDAKAILSGQMVRRKGVKEAILGSTGSTLPNMPHATQAGGSLAVQDVNVYFERGWEGFNFKLEAGFLSGETGLLSSTNEAILFSGYGVATELQFGQLTPEWSLDVKAGIASGDDRTTKDFEGYAFHKNYDVAMLLFNHRLGNADFFGTQYLRETSSHDVDNSFDDEAISNTFYLAPSFGYKWNEKLDVINTVTYAQLLINSTNVVDIKKDLGIEWDIELVYKSTNSVQWINQLGLLFPGSAFEANNAGFERGLTYGFSSKAAISF